MFVIAILSSIDTLIRHSPLPAGNALWFCQNFLFFLFLLFFSFFFLFLIFILPPPRFPDDNFWLPSRPLQNFNRSHVMVIGRSVSFSDPARPPGGAWAAPNTPKSPPSKGTFWKKKFSREKKLIHFSPPPPPPQFFLFFFCVLRPQEDVFCGKKFSY